MSAPRGGYGGDRGGGAPRGRGGDGGGRGGDGGGRGAGAPRGGFSEARGRGADRGGAAAPPRGGGIDLPFIDANALKELTHAAVLPHLFGGNRDNRLMSELDRPKPKGPLGSTAAPPARPGAKAPAGAPAAKAPPAAPASKAPGKGPASAAPPAAAAADAAGPPRESVEDAERRRDVVAQARKQVAEAFAAVQRLRPATSFGAVSSALTNFFPVSLNPGSSYIQYDVRVEPEIRNPRAKREIVTQLLRQHARATGVPEPLWAGAILFATKPLHDAKASKTASIRHAADPSAKGWRSKDVTVTLTLTNTIQRSPSGMSTEEYTVLANVIREAFDIAGFVKIGGKYFDVDGTFAPHEQLRCENDEYQSLQLMRGVNLVLHPTSRGLMLNVDLTFRTTRRGSVLDHIKIVREYLGKTGKITAENINQAIKGELESCIAVTTYLHDRRKQSFNITEVRFDLTPNSPIPGDPAGTTFRQYMSAHHGLDVTDLTQPLLLVRSEREVDRDGKPKERYYLPEFARLAGQSAKMRGNAYLQQELKRICIVGPEVRFPGIVGIVKKVAENATVKDLLKSWGMIIDPRLVKVPARVIPPADLKIGGGRPMQQSEDQRSWQMRRGMTVARAGTIPASWVVIHPSSLRGEQVTAFVRSIMDDTINGLSCNWPEPIVHSFMSSRNPRDNERELGNVMGGLPETIKFVLVVLPDDNETIYRKVKSTTLQEWKIPSQCCLFKNASKPDPRQLLNVTSRIAGQMLVKCGYSLWLSANTGFTQPDSLVCGLAFSSGDGRRTAALVACNAVDLAVVGCFSSEVKRGVEATLEGLLAKALAAFQKVNKRPAASVVIYRPGMHEGEIPKRIHEELLPLQSICTKRHIQICFITALKRCHARFLPAPPGTIVDDHILPATGFSFLIVPQLVRQGTATAMKFSVLANSIPFSDAGQLERLTFALCHMFQGWWASTREPSVVMYATRLADLHSVMNPEDMSSDTGAVTAL